MKLDLGHVVILVCSLLSAVGPLAVSALSTSQISVVSSVVAAVVSVASCLAGILRTSPSDARVMAIFHRAYCRGCGAK